MSPPPQTSDLATFRRAVDLLASGHSVGIAGPEYRLADRIGIGFVARSTDGDAAFVIPLSAMPRPAVARVSSGCALLPADQVQFEFGGKQWNQPAAILQCTDAAVLEAFTILACDVARRFLNSSAVRWRDVVAIVDEWQLLLGRRGTLSAEGELGLWGEVWFIVTSAHPDQLVDAWQGPSGGPVDFVFGAIGAEVKTSRVRLVHHVSLPQVGQPLGRYDSYFVSVWVTVDPDRGRTLPALVDALLATVADPSKALQLLLRAGYSPADRDAYQQRVFALEESWFPAAQVPQVRQVDPGVFDLRYRVQLDEVCGLNEDESNRVRTHFGRAQSGA